jgi:hypothetical protein
MPRPSNYFPRYTFFLVCLMANLIIAWILHTSATVSTKFENSIGMLMDSHVPYGLNVSATIQPEGNNVTTASLATLQNEKNTKIHPSRSPPTTGNIVPQKAPKSPAVIAKVQSQRAYVRNRNAGDEIRNRRRPSQHSTTTSSFSSFNARLRDKYNAKNAPIMETYVPGESDPVRVRILLFEYKNKTLNFRSGKTSAMSDELLNICLDGFEKSPHFESLPFVLIPDDPNYYLTEDDGKGVVWVIDMRRTFRLQQVVSLVNQTLSHGNSTSKLKIVFMDYTDKFYMTLCQSNLIHLFDMLGKENVRQVKQQIVQARDWLEKDRFPFPGIISDPKTLNHCFEDHPAIHAPYTVRSDYVEAVVHDYWEHLPPNSKGNGIVENSLPSRATRTRPTDVAHFWSVREKDSSAHLRNAVTETLLALGENTTIQGRPLRVIADKVSIAEGIGRTSVQKAYTQALLTTKIVVVAQRDGWEDHYRLFEAIVGGALVLTDPMLSLPEGYVDGENIVVYHSLEELTKLVLYYLERGEERVALATKGWQLAMGQHRTFHWMERVFFGQPLTNVTTPTTTET